jgi:hypothetical protein
MRNSAMILIASTIVSFVIMASADAKPQFVVTPKLADEIRRGIEEGLQCALQYLGPDQISSCAFAMARLNGRDGSDTRAYNVGLTFETWRDLDVDWVSDQKLAKSGQVTAAQLHAEETGTRAMYLLYRGARDALGISDSQLLALTKLTPSGRTTTWTRLQFWEKHAR